MRGYSGDREHNCTGNTSINELQAILMKVSDISIYIMKIMWRDFKKIRSSCFRDIQKSAKNSKNWMKLHLDRWWENGLVFKIARKKIHQNFLASKYDIRLHSDAT